MAYKLDAIDRRILYELDRNARVSYGQLAKKVRRSRETVRNRVNRLEKDGIISGFITSINPSKLGYMFFKMYFQLANIPKEREKFFRYFRKLPGLYWFGGNDGAWDFHATLYAKSVADFNKLKNRIYTDFRHLIIKRDIGVLINVRQYPKRYILEKAEGGAAPAMFAGEIEHHELDALDRRILNALAWKSNIPLVNLAKKARSTVDVVRRRMKRMEKLGIIMQYRIAVNREDLGYEKFKAFIYAHNLSEEDEKKLFEYAKEHKNIVYLIRQLSAWDIELEIIVKSYEEFAAVMNDMRLKFSDSIRNYESVLMKEDIWVFGGKEIF